MVFYVGSGDPSPALGAYRDQYFDQTDRDYFEREAGGWDLKYRIPPFKDANSGSGIAPSHDQDWLDGNDGVNGQLVYNTDDARLYVWNGSWAPLEVGAGDIPPGVNAGDILQWSGTAWVSSQALNDKANLNGDAGETFNVADGVQPSEAVNRGQLDAATAGGDAETLEGQGGAYYRNRANHTGTQSADTLTDGSTNRVLTTAEKTNLGLITSTVQNRVGIGSSVALNGDRSVILGNNTLAAGPESVTIGHEATTTTAGTAVGRSANAGIQGVALGESAVATHQLSVALGRGATTTADSTVAIGDRDLHIQGNGKGVQLRQPNGTTCMVTVNDSNQLVVGGNAITSPVSLTANTLAGRSTGSGPANLAVSYSSVVNANTIVQRDGNSRIKAAAASAADDVVVKSQFDAGSVAVVNHGATAGTARPTAGLVVWRGSVLPTNAAATDLIQLEV